jgi:hypothetical protein
MKILELLKPTTFYETLVKLYRNFSNISFYNKTMQSLLKNGLIKQNGMRLDKRNRAYYVLNLEPEILMLDQEAIELEKSRVFESLLVKKALFENNGLSELIEAQTERIKTDDYYAYLIKIQYRPMASFANLFYVICWSALASTVVYYLTLAAINYQSIYTAFLHLLNSK